MLVVLFLWVSTQVAKGTSCNLVIQEFKSPLTLHSPIAQRLERLPYKRDICVQLTVGGPILKRKKLC